MMKRFLVALTAAALIALGTVAPASAQNQFCDKPFSTTKCIPANMSIAPDTGGWTWAVFQAKAVAYWKNSNPRGGPWTSYGYASWAISYHCVWSYAFNMVSSQQAGGNAAYVTDLGKNWNCNVYINQSWWYDQGPRWKCAVIIHELGHGLGWKHGEGPSVMQPDQVIDVARSHWCD
jgi:hypothetical protein